VHHRIHPQVIPFLMGAALATLVVFMVPTIAGATGEGRGGGHAAAAPTRAASTEAAHTAAVPRKRPSSDHRAQPVPTRPAGYYPLHGRSYPHVAGAFYAAPSESTPADAPAPEPPSGWLELDLTPSTAQVYVDGYYAGTVSDFGRPGGRAVDPGPHRIEIRAAGYQTAIVDVRLLPDQPVAYREDLRPVSPSEPARAAESRATGSTTLYVIAGCYMGNVPPLQAALPPGCDAGQVKAISR
jgi:hypothetical protein